MSGAEGGAPALPASASWEGAGRQLLSNFGDTNVKFPDKAVVENLLANYQRHTFSLSRGRKIETTFCILRVCVYIFLTARVMRGSPPTPLWFESGSPS